MDTEKDQVPGGEGQEGASQSTASEQAVSEGNGTAAETATTDAGAGAAAEEEELAP